MEKLKRIPRNYFMEVKYERYAEPSTYFHPMDYNKFGGYDSNIRTRTSALVTFKMELDNEDDMRLLEDMKQDGLEAVADRGLSREAFQYVMNQGYLRLPALLRHPDPDIAEIAWIISLYFSKRKEIMPKDIVE